MNTESKRTRTQVAVEGVSKQFDTLAAVRDVSFEVAHGQTLALLGPSGCGKTTLLRMIAGLEVPDAGTIAIGDTVVSSARHHIPPARRNVGLVFQGGALFPHMTVGENVAYGLGRRPERARVSAALELVDLGAFADRSPATLSGGEAQRVALARALAPQPDVLLLDEPFASLDAELRVRVRTDVAALLSSLDITAIFVTHDQEEAFVVGDQVAVMRSGEILQVGSPNAIYGSPADPWVAEFVGDANLMWAEADGALAHTPVGSIPLAIPHYGMCQLIIRPEYLSLAPGTAATVESVEYYGHDTAYSVALDATSLTVRRLASPRYGVGAKVDVRYDGPEVTAFPEPLLARSVIAS